MLTYEEFDKKYNKRDCHGVVLECSIINFDGDIIFRGTIDEVDNYWDKNIEPIWDETNTSRVIAALTINGQEVVTTNVGKTGRYSDYFFGKLHFNVDRS